MPKVPVQNELEIGARGLPGVAFNPVEAQTHNISRLPDLNQQARSRGFGNGAHLGTGGVKKAELNDSDAAYQAAKQAGALQNQIAQGMSNLGLVIQGIALKERAKADEARIQDAKNQFLRAQLDQEYGESGWRSRKGGAAMPSGDDHRPLDDEYDDRLNSSYQQISQSLGNDRQRELFREWADGERLQQRSKIRAHAMREYDAYREDTYKARKDLAAEMVLRGDVERGIALLQENNTRYADENGLPPEWLETANRQGVSREITATVGQMIENRDLAGANAMLEKYRGHISGEDMAKTAATLKTAQEIRQATDDAEALIRGGDVNFSASYPGDAHAIYNQGYNLDDVIQKIVGVESGGKATAKNPKSSAYGLGQFTKSTWKRFAESPVGKMLKGKMDMAEWLAARATPAIAMQGMRWLTQLNADHLEKHGVPANATTLYLAHFMGAQGAVNLYQADPNQNARAFLRQSDPKHAEAIIQANPTVFNEKRSVGDIMAWSAKHMGVKPDPNAPATGEPRPRSWPSEAQLEAEAQRRYPDNPAQQRAYTDRVRIARNVELEAQKQANDDAYTRAYVAVHSGQGFASIAPEDLKHLTPQQIVGLNESAESIEAKQQQKQHAAARVETLKLSRDPDKLMRMSETDIYQLEPVIGYENTKTLLTARDNLLKDDNAAKTYQLGKVATDSLLRKAYGDNFLDDKDYKQQAENARYFLEGEQLRIINGLIASGQEPTPERIMQELESALLQTRIIEVPGWLWGTNKKEKYLAQLEPWRQEQYRAAERLALKVKTGQAVDGESKSAFDYNNLAQPGKADFSGANQTDLLRGSGAKQPKPSDDYNPNDDPYFLPPVM
ncbi:hypothetical protein [Cardiobacterium hominis]|uniref:hypothetical protein n=1 Tax=Cardiobacterium hominis TaxID=2718 RepID=UPI0028E55554|nr:hypothetical protein [Cardiobacterium hominis]